MTSALVKMEIQFIANVEHKNCKNPNFKHPTNNFTVAILPHAKVLKKISIAQMEIFKAGLNHAIGLAQLPE